MSAIYVMDGVDALKNYLDDFRAQTSSHPFERRARIYKNKAVIELYQSGGRIHLSWIQSLYPKSGAGTDAMTFVTGLADKHGVTMDLSAVPRGTGEWKIPKKKLVEFYKRFGFKGHPDEMIREPVGEQPVVRIKLRGLKPVMSRAERLAVAETLLRAASTLERKGV